MSELVAPEVQVFHTVAVYMRGETEVRVHVDFLGGSPAEAQIDAVNVVSQLGRIRPADLLTRVVATQEIPDAVVIKPLGDH